MDVWRPADSVEVAVAWTAAVERLDSPSSLVLSRQGIPGRKHDVADFSAMRKGAYVLSEAKGDTQVILIATGSEVDLAAKAQEALAAEGINARVVSMPSTNVFDRQDQAYKDSILIPGIKRASMQPPLQQNLLDAIHPYLEYNALQKYFR
jgi:transketolase